MSNGFWERMGNGLAGDNMVLSQGRPRMGHEYTNDGAEVSDG